MNPPACPYARIQTHPLEEYQRVALAEIPGVRFYRDAWLVPWHAAAVLPALPVTGAVWVRPPPAEMDEVALRARLPASPFRPEWFEKLYPHQVRVVCFSAVRDGSLVIAPTGAGKTIIALATAAVTCKPKEGPIVVLTRTAARVQWARETRRFTSLEPYVLSADPVRVERERTELTTAQEAVAADVARLQTDRDAIQAAVDVGADGRAAQRLTRLLGKTEQLLARAEHASRRIRKKLARLPVPLDQYLVETAQPVLIVGWESVAAYEGLIAKLRPQLLVGDEIHNAKALKRWGRMRLPPLPDPSAGLTAYHEAATRESATVRQLKGFVKTDPATLERVVTYPLNNRSAVAGRLARASSRRLALTATPIKDRTRDFYSILDFCEPEAWGNATAFANRYADRRIDANGRVDSRGNSNPEELNARLDYVRITIDATETNKLLPARRIESYYISPEDQDVPDKEVVRLVAEARAHGVARLREARLLESASRKRSATIALVDDHLRVGHKIVVFTGRRVDVETLGKEVQRRTRAPVWAMHGGRPQAERQDAIDDFMAHPAGTEEGCVFIGTGDAFGESLSMHDADVAIFVMLPDTPGTLRQWMGRFYRIGMQRPLLLIIMVAEGTIDERYVSILIDKMPAIELLVRDTEILVARDAIAGADDPTALLQAAIDSIDFKALEDYEDDD